MTVIDGAETPCAEQLSIRETVLTAMDDGAIWIDAEGRHAYANAAASRILSAPAAAELRAAVSGLPAGSRGHASRRRVNVNGSVIEVSAIPDRDSAAGTILLRDVTREIDVERLSHDLVANASHEMKTPVASIRALSASLATAIANDSDAASHLVHSLEHEAERLARMVDDLLRLSRLEGRPPERVPTRINGLVESQAEALRWRAELAGVTLRVKTVPEPVVVLAAEDDLSLLVHNLVENAIRYSHSGGAVDVTLHATISHAVITVADEGLGIPPSDVERIFERFYRVDTARSRDTGGAGLGLSKVRSIADAHGAIVKVDSSPGRGSTFTVNVGLAR